MTVYQNGASSSAPGTLGCMLFRENSSAENATIWAGGGSQELGAIGSSVEFSGAATAAALASLPRAGRVADWAGEFPSLERRAAPPRA